MSISLFYRSWQVCRDFLRRVWHTRSHLEQWNEVTTFGTFVMKIAIVMDIVTQSVIREALFFSLRVVRRVFRQSWKGFSVVITRRVSLIIEWVSLVIQRVFFGNLNGFLWLFKCFLWSLKGFSSVAQKFSLVL